MAAAGPGPAPALADQMLWSAKRGRPPLSSGTIRQFLEKKALKTSLLLIAACVFKHSTGHLRDRFEADGGQVRARVR